MTYHVHVTEEAEHDLLDIWEHVALHDVPGKADDLLEKLEQTCERLSYSPQKGHIPPELDRIGVDRYREIHFKPYRIVYEIAARNVYVLAVLDGRRDLLALLERRLLR
jgi:toxin ParE1/3/4